MPGDKAMQLAALSLVVADGTFNKHLVTAKAIQYVVYSKQKGGGGALGSAAAHACTSSTGTSCTCMFPPHCSH